MSVIERDDYAAFVGFRCPQATYTLLKKLSKATGLSVSELIRRSITLWITSVPEDLPLELKAPITRMSIQQSINLIKDIRWIYHKLRETTEHLAGLRGAERTGRLQPHTIKVLRDLEHTIQQKANTFNQWLATYTTKKQPKGE